MTRLVLTLCLLSAGCGTLNTTIVNDDCWRDGNGRLDCYHESTRQMMTPKDMAGHGGTKKVLARQ